MQLLCPYCHKKFKAPQGLVSHKHMHERAGHVVSKLKRRDAKRPLEQIFPLRLVHRKDDKPAASQILSAPPKVKKDPEREKKGSTCQSRNYKERVDDQEVLYLRKVDDYQES